MKITLDETASQPGIPKRDLQRVLSIGRNLTAAMKELLDTGVISKTLAADVISSLTEKEQEELVSNLDATKNIHRNKSSNILTGLNSLNPVNHK